MYADVEILSIFLRYSFQSYPTLQEKNKHLPHDLGQAEVPSSEKKKALLSNSNFHGYDHLRILSDNQYTRKSYIFLLLI